MGIYFRVHDHNVRTADMVQYLCELHRQYGRPLLVVMDRLKVHHAAVRRLHQRGAKWLHVEWLPAYAPELNPVEAIWSQAKYTDLANFVPDDVDQLCDEVINAVGELHFHPHRLRSFFGCAKLRL